MIREVCLYDKFSYCKNGVKCTRVHLKDVCQNRDCNYRKCDKRHPNPCKFFRMNGYCRFGTRCRYSHRLPKDIEEQNQRIESLEIKTAKLMEVVDAQEITIKELNKKLLKKESKELDELQKQVDCLRAENIDREKAIEKLERDFKDFKHLSEANDKINIGIEDKVSDENDIVNNEMETANPEKEFVKSLDILEAAVNKVRNCGTTNSAQLRSKVRIFNTSMQKVKKHFKEGVYFEWIKELSDVEQQEEKIDRENLMSLISMCRWDLETGVCRIRHF